MATILPGPILAAPPPPSRPRMAPRKASQGKREGWWKPEVAFSLSVGAAWAAIGFLWVITPLCWLYVIWTLTSLHPTLSAGRPSSGGALRILHYVVLSYCALEIPFSILYRVLAYRAQKLRPTPQYTRRFLRSLFKRSLENGLDEEDLMEGYPLSETFSRESNRSETRGDISLQAMRQRRPQANGGGSWGSFGDTGPSTPDLTTNHLSLPKLPMINTDVTPSSSTADERTPSTLFGSPSESTIHSKPGLSYTPSFIDEPLTHDDPRAHDFREYIRVWFNNAKYGDIWRLNMCDWLAWSLYGQSYEDLLKEREEWDAAGRPPLHLDGEPDIDDDDLSTSIEGDKLGLVHHCTDMVEARAARPFPSGRNPKVKVIRLTLDPVKVASRPFVLYAFVWALQNAIVGNAMRHGFRRKVDGSQAYLIRVPKGWTPELDAPEAKKPLLFIHGLGMGLAQYATLLNHLATAKGLQHRPILIPIQPHISMSLFSRGYLNPPDQATFTSAIKRIAEAHGFDKTGMTALSHSNGTIVHGWILKSVPDLLTRSCFVDPVCFCLWEPWVCYNFLYAKPRVAIEYLMRYFVSRELGVALMLQRCFNWSANLLFPSEIPNFTSPYQSAIFLAGRDSILNAERVRKYLVKGGISQVGRGENVGEGRGGLKVHAMHSHGESMIGSGRAFEQIMAWVRCEPGEEPASSGGDADSMYC